MLAQNFKTPADLGIKDAEFDALFKVLGMLEREEIPYVDVGCLPTSGRGTPNAFNMVLIRSRTDCGTAACICGWARAIGNDETMFRRDVPAAVEALFMMSGGQGYQGKFSNEILPAEAAIALRNYLTYGEPRWREALSA